MMSYNGKMKTKLPETKWKCREMMINVESSINKLLPSDFLIKILISFHIS